MAESEAHKKYMRRYGPEYKRRRREMGLPTPQHAMDEIQGLLERRELLGRRMDRGLIDAWEWHDLKEPIEAELYARGVLAEPCRPGERWPYGTYTGIFPGTRSSFN